MSNKVQSCHIFMMATKDQQMLSIHKDKLGCGISQVKGKVPFDSSIPVPFVLRATTMGSGRRKDPL